MQHALGDSAEMYDAVRRRSSIAAQQAHQAQQALHALSIADNDDADEVVINGLTPPTNASARRAQFRSKDSLEQALEDEHNVIIPSQQSGMQLPFN